MRLEVYLDANGSVLFDGARYFAALDGQALEKRDVKRVHSRHRNDPVVALCALTRRLCFDLSLHSDRYVVEGLSPPVALGLAAASGLAVFYPRPGENLFPGRRLIAHARELGVMISVKQLIL